MREFVYSTKYLQLLLLLLLLLLTLLLFPPSQFRTNTFYTHFFRLNEKTNCSFHTFQFIASKWNTRKHSINICMVRCLLCTNAKPNMKIICNHCMCVLFTVVKIRRKYIAKNNCHPLSAVWVSLLCSGCHFLMFCIHVNKLCAKSVIYQSHSWYMESQMCAC